MRPAVTGPLLLGLLWAGAAGAAPRLEAEAAFGTWRPGDPVALRVRLENDGTPGRFELRARQVEAEHAQPVAVEVVELGAGARKVLWLLAPATRHRLSVDLEREGLTVASAVVEPTPQPWWRPLIAVLGPRPQGLRGALDPEATVPELSPDSLPPDPLLWPALDVLVWPEPRAHLLELPQARALRAWVVEGGRLIAGTSPEEPDALESLGLVPTGPGGRLGWGFVLREEGGLRRLPTSRWSELFDLADEPPTARRFGPSLLLRDLAQRNEAAVEPPVAASAALVLALLAGLVLVPLARRRRILRGLPLTRHLFPPAALVVTLGTLAAVALAATGAGRTLAIMRYDLIDVDASTGDCRGQSFLALRRGSAGPLVVDTAGAARLTGESSPDRNRPAWDRDLRQRFDGRGGRLEVEVGSWENLLLRARWSHAALSPPQLEGSAVRMARSLGARQATLFRAGKRSDVVQLRPAAPSDMDRALGGLNYLAQQWPWEEEPRDIWSVARDMAKPDLQWRWPARLRWPALGSDTLLVALSHGLAAPPILVDGVEPAADQGWTIWRVRLPEGSPP